MKSGKKSRKPGSGGRRAGSGRPAYQPTDQQRITVKWMAAAGVPQDRIGQNLIPPCTRETLEKHFGPELTSSLDQMKAQLAESAWIQACGSPAVYDQAGRLLRAEVPRNPTMAIYMTKVQLGWKEKTVHEHSGIDGAPIPIESLNDGQLVSLLKRLETQAS
jgi:hypothetical protein